jgi:energy-coupling factor transport system substrate-specific component
MTEENKIKAQKPIIKAILKNFETVEAKRKTVLYSLIGAGIFILIAMIPKPFKMVGLFKFGLLPALAIIAVVGAIRGPIAGLLTGYVGTVLHDLIFYTVIVIWTLPALAYGFLGFFVGFSTYNMTKERSLIKLSAYSGVGFILSAFLILLIGLAIESIEVLVEIAFVLLPLLTIGVPSVVLLTPIYAVIWQYLKQKPFFSKLFQ